MNTPILPQPKTVADTAPWLLLGGITVVCRCGTEFVPAPTDAIEADGSYPCRACATEVLRWHREMNFDINYRVSDRG